MVSNKMWSTVVLQHDMQDCGPACLATVCKYYGKRIPISYIRKLSGTDKHGTSGYGITQGAKELGFSCYGAASPEKNMPEVSLYPIIAHIKRDNLEHYVVIFKLKKGKVIIGDPAVGLIKQTTEQFKKEWTGIFFVLMPEEKFKLNKSTGNLLTRFFYVLKPHKKIITEVLTASILLSILGIITAFYFRFLVDEVLYSGTKITLNLVSLGYLTVIIFQTVLNISRNQLMLHMSTKIEAALNFEYFAHVLHLPMDFFTSRKTGEVLSRINDVYTIRQVLSSTGMNIILDSLMLIIGGAFLFASGGILMLIAIIPVILSATVIFLFVEPYQRKIKEKAVIDAEKYSGMVESVNGIGTIKALSSEELAFERTEVKMVDSVNKGLEIGTLANIENAVQMALSQLGTLSVYWVGSFKILNGTMSLGQLIAFSILSGYFLGPLGRLLTLQPALQEAFVAASRLSEILNLPIEEETYSGKTKTDNNIKGNIEIKNLTFGYGTSGNVLKKINLKIEAGMKAAFVGPSGSGKTTLVKLLMKFYNFQKGEILIDGLNIKDLETESYRKLIGYVPQEVLLFSGTIRENILWGSGFLPDKALYYAAQSAKADQFINALPERFETIIGERGATLSGGERQRIALARILLREPKILILDEATASLDAITEKAIMNTIREIIQNRTTIIVAHRLSTIAHCDKIFVFDGGKIIEEGKHKELMLKNGIYADLWNAQNS
ncbi:peptidase domain-containing ABC transporter [Treponema pedis]|nr:peptidase domain-containing ABC transporter [Treponema pedis]